MFKLQTITRPFSIRIPIAEQDDFEHFIYTTWFEANRTQKDFVIAAIKKITQRSSLEVIRLDFNHNAFQGLFDLTVQAYLLMPGQCIDLSQYKYERVSTLGEKNVVYEQIRIEGVQCVRLYTKQSPSTVYSVKVAQNYQNCLFFLQQITSGYQAFTLTLESGLFDYDYEKKEVQPSSKIKTKPKIKADGYTLHDKYTLADFMKWAKDQRDIKAPQERLDKTVLVSDAPSPVKRTKKQYENLYWLIQEQQKFINACLETGVVSAVSVKSGGHKD